MKKIFVIMPFVAANDRDQPKLTKFFEDYIKHPIENDFELRGKITVERSGDSFLILDQIILDLANADIVICDLSGPHANPNVMFELGVRLATSHKPVILIREQLPTNARIFDVSGLYTHDYHMNDTKPLEKFIISKIKEYEFENKLYASPVLKILNHEAAFWMQLPIRKASAFLGGIASAAEAHLNAFSRALTIFVHAKGLTTFQVTNTDQCYKSFSQFDDQETLLDDFAYNITSIPSLDSYLSSVYLLGLVDDDIERGFRRYAMSYSLYFNKNNSSFFWSTRYLEGLAYAFETLILMNLCRLIIKILGSRPGIPERQELIEKFHLQLQSSKLLSDGN